MFKTLQTLPMQIYR